MCSATRKELIEVVKYFRDEFDQLWHLHVQAIRDTGMTLMASGMKIINRAATVVAQMKQDGG